MAPLTFLDLPISARKRVYRDAGLIFAGIDIPLLAEARRLAPGGNHRYPLMWNYIVGASGEHPVALDSTVLATIRSLLLTCRAVSADAAAFVYSSNSFYIDHTTWCGLEYYEDALPARLIPPYGLAALTRLNIRLCVVPSGLGCTQWICSDAIQETSVHENLSTALREMTSRPVRGNLLDDWRALAAYVGKHIEPGRLDISFTCDCDLLDTKTARLVVHILLEHFTGPFKECSIRLGRKRGEWGCMTAREVTGMLTHLDSYTSSSFPFERLPTELRLRILEFTDLVVPFKEVSFDPEFGYYLSWRDCACSGDLPAPQMLSPAQLNALPWHDQLHKHYNCLFRNCLRYAGRGCFCRRHHAAWSTSRPPCRCWAPPTALFLVSRGFLREAQCVFFEQNRFVVVRSLASGPKKTPDHYYVGDPLRSRYPASIFLRDVVPQNCLGLLRSLEIVVTKYSRTSLHMGPCPALVDWESTVQAVRDELDFSHLTVRVYQHDGRDAIHMDHPHVRDARKYPSACALILALKSWADAGLKRLFVHSSVPLVWGNVPLRELDARPGPLDEQHPTVAALERAVMGPEYDSDALGKNKDRVSEWLLDLVFNFP